MTEQWRYVCPECGVVRYRKRTTKTPTYMCVNGHTFDRPLDKKTGERRHRFTTQT